MSNTIVSVDSAWVTANGPAPFVLSTENTTYVLAADVSVTNVNFFGDIFVFKGQNIFLDLNGFHIYLNGADYPQKTDGHFYAIKGFPRRLSGPTERAVNTNDDHLFGGIVFDGNATQPLVPANANYKLGVPWSDSK